MLTDKKIWTRKFGLNLRRLMSKFGVSQRELSIRTGLSQHTIGSYLRGEYTPSITKAILIAQALNVEYLAVLDVDGDFDAKETDRDLNDVITEKEWLIDFSWWLSFILKNENISQKYLSEITGINQGLLSKYISATTIPSVYSVVRIAEELAYNDDYDDFLNYGFIVID